MSALIFIGGMVTGFCMGFMVMALLVVARVRSREEGLPESPMFNERSCEWPCPPQGAAH